MEELYVDQLMSRPVETVTPDTALSDAASALLEHDVGSVVVTDERNRVQGLLTATDFVRFGLAGTRSEDATVAEWMRTDVVTTERDAPVSDVVESMLEHLVHHVPVVEDSEAVGMITTFDLTAHLQRSL